MPDTFELETAAGFRRVEFDADVFRQSDVRILVDGERVVSMPYPRAESPHHEIGFRLGNHFLIAMAETHDRGQSLVFDLFADGRSLSGGRDLASARSRSPRPRRPHPRAFRIIDALLLVGPAAGVPGFTIGAMRALSRIGLPTAIAIVVMALVGFGVGTAVARECWRRIRANADWSVMLRALAGGLAVIGIYVAVFLTVLAISRILIPAAKAPF